MKKNIKKNTKKKIRVDKAKNLSKVAKEFVINPLQTEREVAKKTWLGKWTINNLKKELGQIWAKSEDILKICSKDFEIVQKVQEETLRRLQNSKRESFSDIIRAWAESTKRYTLFKWEATDPNWWLKDLSSILAEIAQNKPNLLQ